MAIIFRLISIFILTAFVSPQATAQTYPAYNDLYVNDFADLISNNEENALREKLKAVRNQNGIEMTVVTIAQRADYNAPGSIEDFATDLFNHWGVGDGSRNDGVLILVSRYDREMRIELGSDYGRSRDGDMKRIIDQVMIPYFKRDDYQGGISAGVDVVIYELSGPIAGVEAPRRAPLLDTSNIDVGFFNVILGFIMGVPGIGAAVFFIRRHLRNKQRNCVNCSAPAVRLTEDQEDEYLEDARQLEEMIKSVDYDVWKCHACGHMTIKRYTAWFSKFGACPQCQYKTLESDRTTISQATTSSTGQERIDYDCVNCDYSDTEYRTIPQRTESSSSSSSSSFGGGSSSGGGASGSW